MSATTPDGCCHGHIWIDRYQTHDSPEEWQLCRQLAVERAAHADAIKEAVEKERERCALVAELSAPPYDGTTDTRQIHGASMASMIAAAIREGK